MDCRRFNICDKPAASQEARSQGERSMVETETERERERARAMSSGCEGGGTCERGFWKREGQHSIYRDHSLAHGTIRRPQSIL